MAHGHHKDSAMMGILTALSVLLNILLFLSWVHAWNEVADRDMELARTKTVNDGEFWRIVNDESTEG